MGPSTVKIKTIKSLHQHHKDMRWALLVLPPLIASFLHPSSSAWADPLRVPKNLVDVAKGVEECDGCQFQIEFMKFGGNETS